MQHREPAVFADEAVVEQMRGTMLTEQQQLDFPREALKLRFPEQAKPPVQPAQLLQERRRPTSVTTWRVFQRTQEAVIRGGLLGRTVKGRPMRCIPAAFARFATTCA